MQDFLDESFKNIEPTIGASKTRLRKKFSKYKLYVVSRNT